MQPRIQKDDAQNKTRGRSARSRRSPPLLFRRCPYSTLLSARGGTRIKWGAGSSQCSRGRRSCCRHVYKTGKLVDKDGHPAGVRCEQGSRAEERAQQRVEWRSAGTGRVPRRATHADTDSEDSLAGTTSEHWWCTSSIIFFTNGHWRRFAAIARAQVASAAATPQRIASAATQPAGEVWTHPRCSHPTGQPSSCAVAHERGAVERPVDAHASRRGRGCSEVSCARGEQCEGTASELASR